MRRIEGSEYEFVVAVDFNGPVVVSKIIGDETAIEIPMADLETIVAAKVRWTDENRLADATADELLYRRA